MTCDVNDSAHNIAIGHKIIYNTKFSSPSAAAIRSRRIAL